MWMQKYKKISRFLTFKRFLYQTEEYFYYYFEKTNRNYTNILFFFPTKQKQVSILFLSLPSNLIEVILNKFMSYLITPEGYKPLLDLKQTELGIKQIKEFFQLNLSSELRLRRVTAPLFVLKGMGINDDLNGVERAVTFPIKDLGDAKAEVVHSLAKWKRLTLAEYHIELGYGIYTDMNAIRADEELGNLHSLYVDQWDWERVITAEDRNVEFLKEIVTRIYAAMVRTEYMVYEMYPQIKPCLPQKLHFIHAEELRQLYPDLEPKCREHAICKKYGAVFIIGIGCKLSDGKKHDGRAPDYDDYTSKGLNDLPRTANLLGGFSGISDFLPLMKFSCLLQQALPDVLCHTLTSQFFAQVSQFQCLFHKAQEQAGKILGNLLQIGIVTVIAPDSAAL